MPFDSKKRLFDNLAKGLEAPTHLQEAQARHKLETGYEKARKIKHEMEDHRAHQVRKEKKEKKRKDRDGGAASSSKGPRKDCDDLLAVDYMMEEDSVDTPTTPSPSDSGLDITVPEDSDMAYKCF